MKAKSLTSYPHPSQSLFRDTAILELSSTMTEPRMIDVEVDELLAVDVLQPHGHVAHHAPQLTLAEPLPAHYFSQSQYRYRCLTHLFCHKLCLMLDAGRPYSVDTSVMHFYSGTIKSSHSPILGFPSTHYRPEKITFVNCFSNLFHYIIKKSYHSNPYSIIKINIIDNKQSSVTATCKFLLKDIKLND